MVQTALLAALQFAPSLLTDFYARKVCHSVSGLLMMQLDPRDGLARWYVYAVVVVSLRSPNRPNSFFCTARQLDGACFRQPHVGRRPAMLTILEKEARHRDLRVLVHRGNLVLSGDADSGYGADVLR